MKILLIDVDSKIPNLVLMKLSSYYKKQGFVIELKKLNYNFYREKKKTIIDGSEYKKIFVSIIFTPNKNKVEIKGNDNVFYGGTGFDYKIKLPEDVERKKPDYSLYPEFEYSIGFISRGCIRNCYFCIVPKKEGKLKQVNDWKDIYNPNKKGIIFLDNNFLALKNHKEILKELIENKIRFTFKQGLDIRLIDDENAFLLSRARYIGDYLFAFDDLKYFPIIEKKIKILKKYIPQKDKIKFFVYCHPSMSWENDVKVRIDYIIKNNCLPYIMRDISYKNCIAEQNNFMKDVAAYYNQPNIFRKMPFGIFLKKRHKNAERINESFKYFSSNENDINKRRFCYG